MKCALLSTLLALYAQTCNAVDYGDCKGYTASNIETTAGSIQADLDVIGTGCALFGNDFAHLNLTATYETDSRLHVVIQDRAGCRYQVPEEVVPHPASSETTTAESAELQFTFTESPFTFKIARKSTGEVLFDTSGNALVFEFQFLRLKTSLPPDPNLYGLGEHADPFRLSNTNYTRTLWARDSAGIPRNQNLYGVHPVFFEHRKSGTHGVLLLNSNGMDITMNRDDSNEYSMEIIAIGGIFDFYFMAGPSPVEVARQYAEVIGTPAMIPYWSLGFHQCKFGYQDWFEVAEVITNYSAAGIPLETMWTDIDYMDRRRVFSFDPDRFPISRMRQIAHYLHAHQQQYILMVDPAVGKVDYPAYNAGKELDIFVKTTDGDDFKGVVWPGVTVYPDWFHPKALEYWYDRFQETFNPKTGVDIDGVWIDMNEPTNFCHFPCEDPEGEAKRMGNPPTPPPLRDPPRPLPGFNISTAKAQNAGEMEADPIFDQKLMHLRGRGENEDGDDVLNPPYKIHNAGGEIRDRTIRPDVVHANGLLEYNTHSLYGTMMGLITRHAMLKRRPNLRPFIITRSSFAGAGRYVQRWLGDNASRWDHYRRSIAGMLNYASIFQIPMVGSDVCGFQSTTTEKLCARWATLGAFTPFFRNHADEGTPPQEFYRWPLVADAAKYAISTRYRLLDYFYSALRRQSHDGTPALSPLWFFYPRDAETYALDLQYFYGECLLVSPMTEDEAKGVDVYLPDDVFYEFDTGKKVRGEGKVVRIEDVPFDRIPLHVRGGCVVPARAESANTTTELRKKAFHIMVAPGLDGTAKGSLYVDDGVTLDGGEHRIWLDFTYRPGSLHVHMLEGADPHTLPSAGLSPELRLAREGVRIESVVVLGNGPVPVPDLEFSQL